MISFKGPRMGALVVFSISCLLSGCALNGLQKACDRGDVEGVRRYLDKGVDPNNRPNYLGTPLQRAAHAGQDDVVRLLISRGAKVNDNRTLLPPLAEAVRSGNASTARILLAAGARITNDVRRYAMQSGDPEIRTLILERGAVARAEQPAAPVAEATPTQGDDVDTPRVRGTARPDDFALVVGVEEYQTLPKADFAERDAKTMRRHLEALGFPIRNIVTLLGNQATKSKLQSYLQEWLPNNLKPDSTLFVYYAGHGAPDPKTGEAYLIPWDADPKFLKTSAYPLKQFYSDLSAIKTRQTIVALDSCFSGAGGRSVLARGARPLVAKAVDQAPGASGKLAVLAAASGDETTGALDAQKHGLFTYFLLKGLNEGKTSVRDLYDFLKPKVQDEARRQNREQTPMCFGSAAVL